MGAETYNAQLFNLFYLTWNLSIKRGMREKYLLETGQKEKSEVIYSRITFEEFHNVTRQRNMDALDLIDRYIREARKAFGALGIISQGIDDIIGEDINDEFAKKVANVLKLCTYKMIMKQDASSKKLLAHTFANVLRESELNIIPNLAKGWGVLSIAGKDNYTMKIDVSQEELKVFSGGV